MRNIVAPNGDHSSRMRPRKQDPLVFLYTATRPKGVTKKCYPQEKERQDQSSAQSGKNEGIIHPAGDT